ncbi:MAG: LppX_LprAFG lipoprotein [Nocardioides sp.]|uniref:LppX_LprAFG lipoprotein n=1 Tax=Nocardioides sp. TaxID=35761 RepID=UPI0039E57DBC
MPNLPTASRPIAAAAAVLLLAACGSKPADKDDADTGSSAADSLAAAKKTLDATSGVTLELSSKGVPDDVTALLEGVGILTHGEQGPAFDGTITVQVAGLKPDVPIIAVDGKVYAQVPLTTGWQTIDPSAYGAPDPAQLLATSGGLSDWLTATTGVAKGDTVRGGAGNKELLTTYTGTLPAASAKLLVPMVAGDLDATYLVTDDDQLREVELTGDVYGTGDTETYTVDLDDYGTTTDIKAP